jgi:hypothetical protein
VNVVLVAEVAADEDLFDFELGCASYVGEDRREVDILG